MSAASQRRPAVVIAALLLTGLFSLTCNDNENIPTGSLARPDQIKMISGNNQFGNPQTRLSQPFTVQVLDSDNNPVPSHKVTFEVTSSGGSISGVNEKNIEVVTNANGYTSAYLVLGNDSSYAVTASSDGATGSKLSGSPLMFTAFLVSGADTSGGGGSPLPSTGGFSMSGFNLGADTLGAVGRVFPIPFAVQVLDSLGQGVSALDVFFSSPKGGGVFDITEKPTNQFGVASNACRLGNDPGPVEIQASVILPNGSVGIARWRVQALRDPDVRQNAWEIMVVTNTDSMVGTAGEIYPVPLVVAVTDTFAKRTSGQVVTFLIEENNGFMASGVTSGTASTDFEGLAALNFTLGTKAGLNRIRATVIRMDGLPVSTFFNIWGTAPVNPIMADSIEIVSGAGQTGEVNSLLPEPLVIRVLDEDGAPMSAVDVKFTITGGGPWIGQTTDLDPSANNSIIITTDTRGQAGISMRMGPGPDLDMVVVAEVTREDGSSVRATLSAQALPNPDTANRLVIMSGNNQGFGGEYAVGSQLPLPLVVRVLDSTRTGVDGNTLGAPISNFPVLMQPLSPSGDGSVSDPMNAEPAGTGRLEALTDEDGLASVRWVLGSLTGGPDDLNVLRGNNIVVAVAVFADGSQDSVVFSATAVAGAAATIDPSSATDLSAQAGEALSGLGVTVADGNGNLVAGRGVSFSISSLPAGGSATLAAPTTVITGSSGNASVDVSQASTRVGDMKVAASSGSLTGSPVTFTITVSAGDASQMLLGGGTGQSSKAGTAFTLPLNVVVYDQYLNPVEGTLVTFAVTGGDAALTVNSGLTDTDGIAGSDCTPNAQGAIVVTASVTIGGVATSVTFNLTATAP